MNNKVLYDFRNYNGEEFSFSKNNLQIFWDKINNENMEIIINIIRYSPENITRIHFHKDFDKNLSLYNIEKILLYLMNYTSNLLSLSFKDCKNIDDHILSFIMFSLQNLKKIKILSFESCNLDDNEVKIITEGIKENKSIIALMLRNNNITSQGGFYISEYINNNTNIKQLFLGGNNIKDKGLKSLLNIIATNNKNIINLDLSNNNFNLDDFNTLIEYIKTNPNLNSLDISGNKLELKSTINLGAILSGTKNIKSLNMSNMGIISEYIPNLFKSFNLDEIILDDNDLEEVGLIMLIKGLEGNKNLKKISLKNTQLSFIGLTSLLKMLDKVKDFKELHLENNTIDDSCVNIMKTTLKTKQFKIFVSKSMINQELFKEDTPEKESNIILV
jgi:Ran GTPase-activating protein (RanGAP) involved in mRNA processing and transport